MYRRQMPMIDFPCGVGHNEPRYWPVSEEREPRVNRIRLLLVMVVGSSCVATRVQGAEPVSAKQIAGSWTCASATIDGRPLAEDTAKQLRLTLTADRYKSERGDQVLFDSTYTLDASKSPAHIDMIGTEGDLKGKVAPGILKLDGDMLTMCYVMPGKERPAAFDSQPQSGAFLVVWKRAAKLRDHK